MANGVTPAILMRETLKNKGVVILPLKTYEKMKDRLTRLEEEARVLQIVAEGEREYKEGKLEPVKSLHDLV